MKEIRFKVQFVNEARGLELTVTGPRTVELKDRVELALAASGYPATSSYQVHAPLRTVMHARITNPTGQLPNARKIQSVLQSLRVGLAAA